MKKIILLLGCLVFLGLTLAEAAVVSEPVGPVEPVEPVESINSAELVKAVEPVASAEIAAPSNAAEQAKPSNSAEPVARPSDIWRSRDLMRIAKTVDSIDVNATYPSELNRTPLHYAAAYENMIAIQCLLMAGAKVMAKDDNGRTPLHVAADFSKRVACEKLIASGADVNVKDTSGMTPFFEAMLSADHTLFEMFWEAGGDLKTEVRGFNLLHVAAQAGNYEAVKRLLAAGFEVSAKVKGRISTPLHFAVVSNAKEVGRLLLENKAEVESILNKRSSPMLLAAGFADAEYIALLLQFGADINRPDSYGETPLMLAVRSNNIETIDFMVKNGADLQVVDKDGYNIFAIALRYSEDPKVIEYLLQAGFKLTDKFPGNQTAVHVAAENSNSGILQALVQAGADINAQEGELGSILHAAVKARRADSQLRHLIVAGADANLKNAKGHTPLMFAVVDKAPDKYVQAFILVTLSANKVTKVKHEGFTFRIPAGYLYRQEIIADKNTLILEGGEGIPGHISITVVKQKKGEAPFTVEDLSRKIAEENQASYAAYDVDSYVIKLKDAQYGERTIMVGKRGKRFVIKETVGTEAVFTTLAPFWF